MDKKRKRIIQQIKEVVAAVIPYELIYLFGSAAKESWDGRGDWDLLIITHQEFSRSEKWAFAKAVRIELAKLDIACDILIHSRFEKDETMKSPYSITRTAILEGIKIA